MHSMMQLILAYCVSIPIFIALDLLWLGVVARDFYRGELGHLLGPVNWPAAFVFYAVFLLGLLIFALQPALSKQAWTHALVWGALFGFFTYATYDLTNLATLKGWPVLLSVVDMVWGAFLGGAVAIATYFIVRFIV